MTQLVEHKQSVENSLIMFRNKLVERVAAAARTVVLPAADNQNSGTEISAPAGLSSCRIGTEGSQHSDGKCESECDHSHVDRVDVFPSLCGVPNFIIMKLMEGLLGREPNCV